MVGRFILAMLVILLSGGYLFADGESQDSLATVPQPVPTWPMVGTDADVQMSTTASQYSKSKNGDENVRVVSKIGADLSVENNVNLGSNLYGDSFSGGANLTQPYQAPAGFNPYQNQGLMPFMNSEMPEDDGSSVLSISKTNRKPVIEPRVINTSDDRNAMLTDIAIDSTAAEPSPELKDQVRSWVVASGQSLREVLKSWCDKEGWDLIWNTPREYPISASAVFKGRFLDVSSALVRNFSRATPVPYAKFYKGNRVLVIGTTEDE